MKIFDRVLTIVITATLTCAIWIVFGGTWLENAERDRAGASVPDTAMSEDPGGFDGSSPPLEADTDMTPAEAQSREAMPTSLIARIPVEGVAAAQLTDSFLDARGPDDVRLHEAIDIMAPGGTAVIAAAGGTVAKLHDSAAGGKTIYIRSPDRRIIYYYAHLDEYAPDLREGGAVRAGDRLGTVGSTGNASPDAPHLHFAMIETTSDARWWEPGTAINPYPLLTQQD
ncbi:MAG: M23 family metallopeptidase [Erythrobacter sp.]|nr:M23 family metallopeptidase [Erythrobacter sp.]